MTKGEKKCPFCEIASGRPGPQDSAVTSAILFQDDQVVAFLDRNPSAFKHYLIIPVAHVKNVSTLEKSKKDFGLVLHMQKTGQRLLQQDAPNSQHRFGFHRPPFNSVDHLHLHCLALPYLSCWRSVKYSSLGGLGAWVAASKVLGRLDPGEANVSV